MSQLYQVIIGFGDAKGSTSHIFVQENLKKIERLKSKNGYNRRPKIKIKQYPQLNLGSLGHLLKNRRDKNTLNQLFKVPDINLKEISLRCQNILNRMINQQQIIKISRQDFNLEKDKQQFIKQTKASAHTAQKYINQCQDIKLALSLYKQHQNAIEKFMKLNKCDRETAIGFLQGNNYNMEAFE